MHATGHLAAQTALAGAICQPMETTPAFLTSRSRQRVTSGLNVYRNNIAASLLNVLSTRFPTVRTLAGEESFFQAARAFLEVHPPRSPVLAGYGEGFPDFLRQRCTAACHWYIADIAELELARGRAYHAADAAPVGHSDFALIPAEKLGSARLTLHPSLTLISSRFPIVSVWQAHQTDGGGGREIHNRCAEAAMVARAFLEVEVCVLPSGGFAFISALSAGQTISQAVEQGVAAARDFDLAHNLATVIGANIVTAIIAD